MGGGNSRRESVFTFFFLNWLLRGKRFRNPKKNALKFFFFFFFWGGGGGGLVGWFGGWEFIPC